jgi:hypothetical protein
MKSNPNNSKLLPNLFSSSPQYVARNASVAYSLILGKICSKKFFLFVGYVVYKYFWNYWYESLLPF